MIQKLLEVTQSNRIVDIYHECSLKLVRSVIFRVVSIVVMRQPVKLEEQGSSPW